jgi:hypothetical protein
MFVNYQFEQYLVSVDPVAVLVDTVAVIVSDVVDSVELVDSVVVEVGAVVLVDSVVVEFDSVVLVGSLVAVVGALYDMKKEFNKIIIRLK